MLGDFQERDYSSVTLFISMLTSYVAVNLRFNVNLFLTL